MHLDSVFQLKPTLKSVWEQNFRERAFTNWCPHGCHTFLENWFWLEVSVILTLGNQLTASNSHSFNKNCFCYLCMLQTVKFTFQTVSH
uniref:Uncharacterized protein n=1 Tax=Setaria italica TaxID=4555 RepID=K3ZB91_SETIT